MASLAHLRGGQLQKRLTVQLALRHGIAVGSVLLTEIVIPIPVALMASAAVITLIPLVGEIWHHLQHEKSLPAETLELAFSGVVVCHGHLGEALLDLFMGDTTKAINQAVSGEEDFHGVSRELLDWIGNLITLEHLTVITISAVAGSEMPSQGCATGLTIQSHAFQESQVIEGEVMVLNHLYDGNWQPQRLSAGDAIHEGAFIIKGHGTLEVIKPIDAHSAYQLSESLERPTIHTASTEGILQKYKT